jgi:hypothetical protein
MRPSIWHAVRWDAAGTDLAPASDYTVASDINDRGVISGGTDRQAAWWERAGRMTPLEGENAAIINISQRGLITGTSPPSAGYCEVHRVAELRYCSRRS